MSETRRILELLDEWDGRDAEGLITEVGRILRRSHDEGDRDLDDANSAYWNLRTCICGADAREHRIKADCPHGFDPDWEAVRKSMEARQIEEPQDPTGHTGEGT